ncbi:hypothetical protein BGZ83_001231 [Gryganskiella cystojenkinii]|nr:hypothetical protein BGZ83_001231 [Gryganskiella cystojenkinii]
MQSDSPSKMQSQDDVHPRRSLRLAKRRNHHEPRRQIAFNAPPSNPLFIPEILSLIGHYLQPTTVFSCLQVCRLWYQAFLNFHWKTLQVFRCQFFPRLGPDFSVLLKYSKFIENLVIKLNRPFPSRLYCPKLIHLEVGLDGPEEGKNVNSLVQFLKRHHTTKSWTTLSFMTPVAKTILDELEHLPASVSNLHLRKVHGRSIQDWELRLKNIFSRLHRLSLKGPWIEDEHEERDPEYVSLMDELSGALGYHTTTQIQELELDCIAENDVMLEVQFMLILKSPGLTRLHWRLLDEWGELSPEFAILTGGDLMGKLVEEIQVEDCCPWKQLSSLTLSGMDFENQDFRILIQALAPTLKELNLNKTTFDRVSWDFLQAASPLRTTLRTLSLERCSIDGLTTQGILCTMQGLEVFRADYITDLDVLRDDRPWVCTGMREFSVGFVLLKAKERTEQRILARLSGFQELEVLRLSFSHRLLEWHVMDLLFFDQSLEDMRLTLRQGLGQLKSLKKLRVLELPVRREISWSVKEAKWIQKNWQRLEEIIGNEAEDEKVRLLLKGVWVVPHITQDEIHDWKEALSEWL